MLVSRSINLDPPPDASVLADSPPFRHWFAVTWAKLAPLAKVFSITKSGNLVVLTSAAFQGSISEYKNIVASGNIAAGGKMSAFGGFTMNLTAYANNAAALAAGLTAGQLYRTGGDPDQVCVVH